MVQWLPWQVHPIECDWHPFRDFARVVLRIVGFTILALSRSACGLADNIDWSEQLLLGCLNLYLP